MPHTTIEAMPPVEYISLTDPELSSRESPLADRETAYTSGELPASSGPDTISRTADFGDPCAQSPRDELPEPLRAALGIALKAGEGNYNRNSLEKPDNESSPESPGGRTPDAGGSGRGGKPPDAIPSLGGFEEPEEEPERPNAATDAEIKEARERAAFDYLTGKIKDNEELRRRLEAIGEPPKGPENPEKPEAPETKTYTAAEAANEIAEIFKQPVKPEEVDFGALSERIRKIIIRTPEFNTSGMTDVEDAEIREQLYQRLMEGRPNKVTADIARGLLWRYWPGSNAGTT